MSHERCPVCDRDRPCAYHEAETLAACLESALAGESAALLEVARLARVAGDLEEERARW